MKEIDDPKFPKPVKAYRVDAIEAFRVMVEGDPDYLVKYRR